MRSVFTKKARRAVIKTRERIAQVDPDDWDQRPDNICICGYSKNTCMCPKVFQRVWFHASYISQLT